MKKMTTEEFLQRIVDSDGECDGYIRCDDCVLYDDCYCSADLVSIAKSALANLQGQNKIKELLLDGCDECDGCDDCGCGDYTLEEPCDTDCVQKATVKKKLEEMFPKFEGPVVGFNGKRESNSVDHPDHYGGADNPYEAIKVMENIAPKEAFQWHCVLTAMKYLLRWNKKGEAKENIGKAVWYLQRLLTSMEDVKA